MGGSVWTGFGSIETALNRVNRPSNVAGVSRQSVRTTSMPSLTRAPRSLRGTPQSSNSFGFSPPTPTPKTSRPPDRTSTVAAIFAATAGARSARRYTAVPSRMRRVIGAYDASSVNDS